MSRRPIVFLSDYGLEDEFVGVCHAVIAGIAPETRVIDLTHGVPPHDVRRAALALAAAVPYAPAGTVFLAVVDPGVGTDRRAVVVEAGEALLVGPDNGLLAPAWERLGGPGRAFAITSRRVLLTPVSATFHGRDVFAPAAAHLAAGLPPERVGEEVDPAELVRLEIPAPRLSGGEIRCEVIAVDRFGNLQLSARREDLEAAGLTGPEPLRVEVAGRALIVPRASSFAGVPEGRDALVVDSSGFLALVRNRGSAASGLSAGPGDPVVVALPDGGG